MSLIADTLRAAIESLALYCNLKIACKMTFAKVRRSMLFPGTQGLDDSRIALELRQVLEMGGDTLELMNNEYVGVMNVTPTEVLNRSIWTASNPWMPPAWRAPSFGTGESDYVNLNTAGMEHFCDRVVADWKISHNGEDLSIPQLKMYMTGLAAQAVQNKQNKVQGYEQFVFDGDD